MHIDSYQFGKIVIDGTAYCSDLIVLADSVKPNWRRKRGHWLSVEDLACVIDARPSVLVVGCGAYGIMKVPEPTRQFLAEKNIELHIYNTHKAAQKFNELAQTAVNVAAALHLTC